jgi:hypothetical protein
MPADVTARNRHDLTRAEAIRALRELAQTGTPVSFELVARGYLHSGEFPQGRVGDWGRPAAAVVCPAAVHPAGRDACCGDLER